MIHVDAETLRKYPVLGVLIGAAAAVMMGYIVHAGWPEARALQAQKTPAPASVHEVVNESGVRWVTVSEGQWHCEEAITLERRLGFERWVFGRVESTEVPITGPVDGEILVASFHGALPCSVRAGSSLTGVVGSTKIFGSRSTSRRWSRAGSRVTILKVGASPRSALLMFVGLAVLAIGGIVFAGCYLRIMLRSGARHSHHLPSSGPIQPN